MLATPTDLPTRRNKIVVLTIYRYLQRKHAMETSRQSTHFVEKLFFFPTSVNITIAVGTAYNIHFGNAEHVPVRVPISLRHGTPAAIVVIHYHYIVHYVLAVYHTAIVPI